MKITKDGFYCLKDIGLEGEKIIISSGLNVSIFDNRNKNLNIEIGENSKLDFFGVISGIDGLINIEFLQNEINSKLVVRCLLLSKNNNVNIKVQSNIGADNVRSDLKILSIVGNKGFIDLDGVLKIGEKIKGVVGVLKEENLFLGDTGKINGTPTLLVRSNDVNASHSCKIEKISDEKLFYLRSRGIGKNNVLNMMIDSYINELFSGLEFIDKKFFDKSIISLIYLINN